MKKISFILLMILLSVPFFGIIPSLDSQLFINAAKVFSFSNSFFSNTFHAFGNMIHIWQFTYPPLIVVIFKYLIMLFGSPIFIYFIHLFLVIIVFLLSLKHVEHEFAFFVLTTPLVFIFINSLMASIFAVFFAFLGLFYYFNNKRNMLLSSLFFSMGIFVSYKIAILIIAVMLYHFIRHRKIDIAIYYLLIPFILLLSYFLLVYVKTKHFIPIEMKQWYMIIPRRENINIIKALLILIPSFGFFYLPLLFSFKKVHFIYIAINITLFFLSFIVQYTLYLFVILCFFNFLLFFYLLYKKGNKLLVVIYLFSLLLAVIFAPNPSIKQFAFLTPLLIFSFKDIKLERRMIPLITAIMILLMFSFGKYDIVNREVGIANRAISEFSDFYSINSGPIQQVLNNAGIREYDFSSIKSRDIVATIYDLNRIYLPFNISEINEISERSKLMYNIFSERTDFYNMTPRSLFVYEPTPILLKLNIYKIGKKKESIKISYEHKLSLNYNNFQILGYSIHKKGPVQELKLYVHFDKYMPIYIFIHDKKGKPLYQKWKEVEHNSLDPAGNAMVIFPLPTSMDNIYLLCTKDNLKPLYAKDRSSEKILIKGEE
ncbi:hypothetical protein J7L48_05815 [bacterium]|nr:hypothetical protein [bacterium]